METHAVRLMPPSLPRWLSCSCAYLPNLQWSRTMDAYAHCQSFCLLFCYYLLCDIRFLIDNMKYSFPFPWYICIHISLPDLLVFNLIPYFLWHIYSCLKPLLFSHTIKEDQLDSLKPCLLGGFPSPLPFRVFLSGTVEKNPSIFLLIFTYWVAQTVKLAWPFSSATHGS